MLPPTKRRRSEPRAFHPRAGAFAIAIAVNTLAYIAAGAESTTCGGDLTDSYGVVLSPTYPQPYPADVSCLWHIAPNVTHTNGTNNGLTLTFTKFQTQPDDGTSGISGDVETLFVYTSDPSDNASVPYRRYRGKTVQDPLTIPSSREIWLKFQSSSTQTTPGSEGTLGFRIIYLANGADVQCNADPLQNGRISNGNGSFIIGSSVEFQCDWGFRMEGARESVCRLEDAGAENVQPEWTQLPKCVSTCTTPAPVANGSYVKSSSSLNVNSTVTYFCSIPYLLSRQNPVVTCTLDTKGIPHWDQETPSCAIPNCESLISLTGSSGAIVNPSYPRHFVLGGTHCEWNISVQEGKVVSFNVSCFDLPADSQMTIAEWKSQRLLHVFQGGQGVPSNESSLNSSSNHVKVVYNGPPGNSTSRQGFFISYRAVEPSGPRTLPTTSSSRQFSSATPMETSSTHQNGPSTEKVTRTESGGDGSASKIAIGVTVPIILIVAIAVVVYWCYRRKYPVRMILGRDFGKFTNPEYRPSTKIHSLVRDDADLYFHQQMQPTGPAVNLILRGDDEEAKAEYVNVAFQYDSQDADEEEVERRFRQHKSYLFKKDEEDEVDGGHKEKQSPEDHKKDEERSKKRHRPKENGRVGRDQGHDNAAYTEDFDVDSVSAEDTDKTKDDKSDSESTSSDVSVSSDKPNRPNSSEAGNKSSSDKQNNKVSEIQPTAPAGGSSGEDYHSWMTVTEFLQKAHKHGDQGDADKKGKNHEADEKREESFFPQMAQDLRDSGIRKVSGMTVREFLKLAKEKRAMSDVTRVRAGSLTTPYGIEKSARRRAQSAEGIWEKAAEPFKSDEKLLPKNSNKTPAATPPSVLRGDARQQYKERMATSPDDNKESEGKPIPLIEGAAGKIDTESSFRSGSLSSVGSDHPNHTHSQDDVEFADDNARPSSDSVDTTATTYQNVPEFTFVLDRCDDLADEADLRGLPETGQLQTQDYDEDVSPSSSFVVLSSSGAGDIHSKGDNSDSISIKTGTSRGSDSISLNDADFDRGSLDSFHRHEAEFEQDDALHLGASRNDPSNESTKKAISVQGLKTLTYSDTSSTGSPSSDSDDAADSSGLVASNRNIKPRPLQIGETSPVKMNVELEDEDTETQPMELSFTTESRDSKFPPKPELPPGALQLTSSATNEPAASRVIQMKSSPPQPTRLRGLAALKMHPSLRSTSSDSDNEELTVEDIEAVLGEGSEVSSDEEAGPRPPPINAAKVKLPVDPKKVVVLGEDTDDDEIDV